MHRLNGLHTAVSKPVLVAVLFGQLIGKGIGLEKVVLFIFKIIQVNGLKLNNDIQWGGTAQFLVDDLHTLVNLGALFEVIDKAVFHHQVGSTHNTGDGDDCGQNQNQCPMGLGKACQHGGQ